MVGRDAGYLKSIRLKEIEKKIAKNIANGVDLEKLLDWVEYEQGLRRKTALQYVELILKKQDWIVESGVIKAGAFKQE
jgi:hypothetical protein